MPRHKEMSGSEPDSSLWGIRWADTLGEVEADWKQRPPKPLQARVFNLRSTLQEIGTILESIPECEAKQEIRSRIVRELSTLEWGLTD